MSNVYRLVATSGISVLAKHNQLGKQLHALCNDLVTWDRNTPTPLIDEADAIAQMCERGKALVIDPARRQEISAEYSMLLAMRNDEQNRLANGAYIDLVHTSTFAGAVAARLVARALEADFGVHVGLHAVDDLDVTDTGLMRSALGGFMRKTAELLEQGEPRGTRFAPLGGYKIMTSLAYVAGAYLGFPTLYLHENNQIIHTLPAVPIAFKADVAATLAAVMRRTARTRTFSALSARHQSLINAHDYLFDRIGDEVELNAFGLFLRTRPELQSALRPEIQFSRAARQAWASHGRSHQSIRNQIEMLTSEVELDQHERRADTHHEFTWSGKNREAVRKADFHLFKGSEVRMTWSYSIEADRIRINYTWISHDQYELDVDQMVGVNEREYAQWETVNDVVFG